MKRTLQRNAYLPAVEKVEFGPRSTGGQLAVKVGGFQRWDGRDCVVRTFLKSDMY